MPRDCKKKAEEYIAMLTRDMTVALRDALIEAYPLPTPPEASGQCFQKDLQDAYDLGWHNPKNQVSDAPEANPLQVIDSKWQEVTVDPKGAGHTYRLRVPGGWLYRTVTMRYPELHRQWEEMSEEEDWDDFIGMYGEKGWQKAQEILTQTAVFIADDGK